MANRMDIELTSVRDDEFTWRAAGARQPRGSVAGSLLPPSSRVGDVLRAEVEVELDGITVVAILPPKEKAQGSGRIEYLGPPRPAPGVTTTLARGERPGRPERRREGRREGRPESRREGRPERRHEAETEPRRTEGRRPARPGERRREGEGGRQLRRETGPRRGPARFEPGTAHRDELFATLSPEQRAIAERLAAGGLPAVRKAIAEEQQRAKAEGRPSAAGDPIVAIAEQLLPQVRAAVWLDRAEAAVGRTDEITLRDLRATVVGASPRDEAGKELERRLREALERRVSKLRSDWEAHITQAMADGRVLQALRLSARPPEPTARFPGALAGGLAELAGGAMTEETAPDRWLSLLEASAESPVHRQVKPSGMPKDPSGEVERQARTAASRIPALARLIGMPIPPPPRPGSAERRPPARRGRRQPERPAGQEAALPSSPGEAPDSAPPAAAATGWPASARSEAPDTPEEEVATEPGAVADRPEEGAGTEQASQPMEAKEVVETLDEAQSS